MKVEKKICLFYLNFGFCSKVNTPQYVCGKKGNSSREVHHYLQLKKGLRSVFRSQSNLIKMQKLFITIAEQQNKRGSLLMLLLSLSCVYTSCFKGTVRTL